jgi:predicted dehydrogenase
MHRVGIIGSGQKGGYGHSLETAFGDAQMFEVVAVADDDAASLAATGKRLRVERLYADFREMLSREKLHVVAIGPRWVTERVAMVRTAAQPGCHIFLEKPFAATVAEADAMVAACEEAGVKCALAHQLRMMPPVVQAFSEIRAGKYGKLLRMYGQPSDDARGGGEELVVHGDAFFRPDDRIGRAAALGKRAFLGRRARRDRGRQTRGPRAGRADCRRLGGADGRLWRRGPRVLEFDGEPECARRDLWAHLAV